MNLACFHRILTLNLKSSFCYMNRHLTAATVSVWIEINFALKALDFVHNYFYRGGFTKESAL